MKDDNKMPEWMNEFSPENFIPNNYRSIEDQEKLQDEEKRKRFSPHSFNPQDEMLNIGDFHVSDRTSLQDPAKQFLRAAGAEPMFPFTKSTYTKEQVKELIRKAVNENMFNVLDEQDGWGEVNEEELQQFYKNNL